ncbi:MAG: GNAT family N-acetyltransferase [Pleurocapsa sp.]
MPIQHLDFQNVTAYRAIRPLFNSSYEEEKKRPLSDFYDLLVCNPNRITFGVLDIAKLVAIVCVTRDKRKKVNHKGSISSMYVSASHQGRGIGKQLLTHTLEFADLQAKLSQLTLVVNVTNISAISLYQSFGFKMFGIEPFAAIINGEPQNQMHMVRLKNVALNKTELAE